LEKIKNKLSGWKEKVLSYAGKLLLIKHTLIGMSIDSALIFKIPSIVCIKIDHICRRFL